VRAFDEERYLAENGFKNSHRVHCAERQLPPVLAIAHR
jgi:hypothetical protein